VITSVVPENAVLACRWRQQAASGLAALGGEGDKAALPDPSPENPVANLSAAAGQRHLRSLAIPMLAPLREFRL